MGDPALADAATGGEFFDEMLGHAELRPRHRRAQAAFRGSLVVNSSQGAAAGTPG